MWTLVEQLAVALRAKNWRIATAESCTGGLIASTITDRPGASEFYEGGFITYSNDMKIKFLNVELETIEKYGAVSPETAKAMAKGVLNNTNANVSLSVTGIAGPSGGSAEKPVGLVYIGFGLRGGVTQANEYHFTGTRQDIRLQAIREALKLAIEIIEGSHE